MTEPQFYVKPHFDGNPTIWERDSLGGSYVVARQRGGVVLAYEDLAFAVLARVLAPDEATIERVADIVGRGPSGRAAMLEIIPSILAALAEDPAEVSS